MGSGHSVVSSQVCRARSPSRSSIEIRSGHERASARVNSHWPRCRRQLAIIARAKNHTPGSLHNNPARAKRSDALNPLARCSQPNRSIPPRRVSRDQNRVTTWPNPRRAVATCRPSANKMTRESSGTNNNPFVVEYRLPRFGSTVRNRSPFPIHPDRSPISSAMDSNDRSGTARSSVPPHIEQRPSAGSRHWQHSGHSSNIINITPHRAACERPVESLYCRRFPPATTVVFRSRVRQNVGSRRIARTLASAATSRIDPRAPSSHDHRCPSP